MKIEFSFILLFLSSLAESATPRIRYKYRELSKDGKMSLEDTATGDSEFHLEFPVATRDFKTTSLRIKRYHMYIQRLKQEWALSCVNSLPPSGEALNG